TPRRPPPRPTLSPYTTLFRSRVQAEPTDDEIWRAIELARHEERPYTLDYIERLCDDFVELHGDRGRADDAAIVAGLGRFEGRTVDRKSTRLNSSHLVISYAVF